jgi:uncharacterized protein (TIGR02996 family)
MLDREPFLRAIFADPGNGLPRLVFADFLEERGEADWAELLRVECELGQLAGTPGLSDEAVQRVGELVGRKQELVPRVFPGLRPRDDWRVRRGFLVCPELRLTADDLGDAEGLRRRAVAEHPEWYGATRLKVAGGRVSSPGQLATILTSPVTERVTELDLSGRVEEAVADSPDFGDALGLLVTDLQVRPTVTVAAVELLARSREARRLTALDLTNNDLDNDAARAIARSPHLFRLRRLAFSRGNRFLGRTWKELVERYGEDVME